jgi:hypothetical protein
MSGADDVDCLIDVARLYCLNLPRIIKYDLNGWLGVVGGPLKYIKNSIKSIRGQASQVNKNPDKFQIIIS